MRHISGTIFGKNDKMLQVSVQSDVFMFLVSLKVLTLQTGTFGGLKTTTTTTKNPVSRRQTLVPAAETRKSLLCFLLKCLLTFSEPRVPKGAKTVLFLSPWWELV